MMTDSQAREAIRADLHAHTTASDGALSPTELVTEAAARGITHLAITDHDTVAGFEEAKRAGQKLGVEVICGIEITASVDKQVVHVLGLGVDPSSQRLHDFTAGIVASRRERFVAMLDKVRKVIGLELPPDEELLPEKAESLTRPRLARILIEAGHCQSVDDAFQRYLGKRGPAYVPHIVPEAREAIAVIHAAHGVSSLAHCGLYYEGEAIAERLFDQGLMALEVYHPDHDFLRRERLLKMVHARGALISGGADFHAFESAKAKHFGRSFTNANDF
ncbi:MAG: PHP domain-containing protein, partial [Planctomycetes bacterium]|nr:PHP domain-containing protein [Planctomycetota bacterium]